MLTDQRTRQLLESAPAKFFELTLGLIFDAYLGAYQSCREFSFPEDYNLRPIRRRQQIERDWRKIAGMFQEDGIVATYHRVNGFWYHTRIICNEKILLTHSPVKSADGMIRTSESRAGYAAHDNQLWLLPDCAENVNPLLYGIVVYGRSDDSWKYPGFAKIRFPNERLTEYLPGGLDLFQEFPDVVHEKMERAKGVLDSATEDLPLEPELLDDYEIPEAVELQ